MPQPTAKPIIDIARSYLARYQFPVYPDVAVELHRCKVEDGERWDEIGFHTDNDPETDERVKTVVFYLHKFEYKPGSQEINLCTTEVTLRLK